MDTFGNRGLVVIVATCEDEGSKVTSVSLGDTQPCDTSWWWDGDDSSVSFL